MEGQPTTEGAARSDQGGPDVEEGSGLRQPPLRIHGDQRFDEILDGARGEIRAGNARRREQEAGRIPRRAEQSDLAVVATVRLQPFEALGGVVQTRRSGPEIHAGVRPQFRSVPADGVGPPHGHPVVGGRIGLSPPRRLGPRVGLGRAGNGDLQLCGVELGEGWAISNGLCRSGGGSGGIGLAKDVIDSGGVRVHDRRRWRCHLRGGGNRYVGGVRGNRRYELDVYR